MKAILPILGISKQGFWKHEKRCQNKELIIQQAVDRMNCIRLNHKKMGCRKMYHMSKNIGIGRDAFMQIGYSNGFKIGKKRNPVVTTWGQRAKVYSNLIDGLTITGINQVWQSDITYLEVEGVHYYGICIEDLCSRRLLALHVSKSLKAIENVKALKKALSIRANASVKGCIFHSDRGSQYISALQETILKDHQMIASMGKVAQENAYVERINQTLKYEYFYEMKLTEKNILEKAKKVMWLYNNERPHESIGMKTPTEYEHLLLKNGDNDVLKMRIHDWNGALSTEYQVVNKEKSSKKESLPNT